MSEYERLMGNVTVGRRSTKVERGLEAEIDRLKAQIGALVRDLGGDALLPSEWGLTPSEARLVGLLARRGQCTRNALWAVLYHDRRASEPDPRILDVFISRARKKLRAIGVEIVTTPRVGYGLTPEGRAILEASIKAWSPHAG